MKILIADPGKEFCAEAARTLTEDGHAVSTTGSAAEAFALFEKHGYEVVIADSALPDTRVIEFLRKIKSLNGPTQVVITSATATVDDVIDAMRDDAFDFIVKPVEDYRILSETAKKAIDKYRAEHEHKRLMATLNQQNRQLDELNRLFREMAIRDGLTGLFNHRYANDQLVDEYKRAEQFGQNLSVLFADLDHFKHYNDRNGHQAGDELLRRLGQLLKDTVRQSDTVGRWGGEEFIVVAPETDLSEGCQLAERLRMAVAEHSFPHDTDQPLGCVSFSIGIAAKTKSTKSPDELIRLADDAVYKAKQQGRNAICVAGS